MVIIIMLANPAELGLGLGGTFSAQILLRRVNLPPSLVENTTIFIFEQFPNLALLYSFTLVSQVCAQGRHVQ